MGIEITRKVYIAYVRAYGMVVSGSDLGSRDFPIETSAEHQADFHATVLAITQAAIDAESILNGTDYLVGFRSLTNLRKILGDYIKELESPGEQGEDPFDEENPVTPEEE